MDLDVRLGQIERRLAALERREGATSPLLGGPGDDAPASFPPPVAEPVPGQDLRAARPPLPVAPPSPVELPPLRPIATPTPTPRRIPRTTPRARRESAATAPRGAEWERFVGVAVLGRVGIAAILLAAAWFAQLAYQAFPPAWRVASIEGLAVALAAVGFFVRPRVSLRFLAILWGGATAAAYMAGVVARLRYGLVGPLGAGAMLVAACALGQTLARIAGVRALAHVALAGALAAPFLVGSTLDARTSLLVYVLVVHGWAAFTEARWGWRGARVLAVLGSAVVALAWLAEHGATDASTCLHVQLYLAGLSAPEWLAALRGRDVGSGRSQAAFGLVLFAQIPALLVFAGEGPVALARGFPLLAGAFWGSLAVLARRRAGRVVPAVEDLARVGETLLVVAAMTVWPRDAGAPPPHPEVLAALSTVAVAFVALRSRFGTGTFAALLATAASLVLLFLHAAPDPWVAVALVAPAAVAVLGESRLRPLGLAAGVVAMGLGLARAPDPWWPALAFAGAGAWLAGGYALAVRRRDDLARGAADVLWVVAASLWAWAALAGPFAPVARPLANPGTFAALALLLVPAVRRLAGARTDDPALEGFLRLVLVGVGLSAAWREWHAAAGAVSALALAEWHATAFLTAAAGAVLATATPRLAALHRALATALYLAATGVVLGHAGESGTAWAFAVETALLAVPAALLGRGALAAGLPATPGAVDPRPLLALVPAVLWAVAALEGPLRGSLPGGLLLNARFASAAVLSALLAFLRAKDAPGPRAILLGAGAALLATAAGLAETLDVVARLDSPTLRHALVSVYLALAAAAVLAVGFVRRAPDLRWLALAGFAAVIAKVGLHDLADAGTSVRILVTGVLGVVLLVCAYAYARRERGAVPAGP